MSNLISPHFIPDTALSRRIIPARVRPHEYPFTAAERGNVTILFSGLTWKHERLITALLSGAGYLCQRLPETDRTAHEIGKEFCSSGLCNPVYFTVGNLIRFLEEKHREGIPRNEIVKRYVYFTAACGGPCRFGMYETEFRTALSAAGYDGFRVLSFSQDRGIHAETGHTGLQFSVDFGMHALQSFVLGDLLNIVERRLRPFETCPGTATRAVAAAAHRIAQQIEHGEIFEFGDCLPGWLCPQEHSLWYRIPNTLGKLVFHLRGIPMQPALAEAAAALNSLEVDWLRPKPVIKIIGEFWAQMTESDGNFRMLDFLEKEGAEVSIEPISTWLLYLLYQRREQVRYRLAIDEHEAPWSHPVKALKARVTKRARMLAFELGAKIYLRYFYKLARMLKASNCSLPPQPLLAGLASPYFNTRLRGGEGHLEVGKTLYYQRRQKSCHLVLALKPFGCLPSVQSDAVQAALVERFPEVNFLSVETSADGAIHAYSRVQMALAEARTRTEAEFELTLGKIRHSLAEIRAYVALHRELRDPLLRIPRHPGIISTAANFLLLADEAMSADMSEVAGATAVEDARRNPALESVESPQEMKS